MLDEAVKNSDDDYVLTWTGTDGDYLKTITIGINRGIIPVKTLNQIMMVTQ